MARLGILVAFTIVALAGTARAAEITHVATAAEPDKAVEIDLSVGFQRTQKRERITREMPDATAGVLGGVTDRTMLRYTEVSNAIVPRAAIGLYNDLELHFQWPYVLSDDVSWRYGQIGGVPVNDPASEAYPYTPDRNGISPSGTPCPAAPCPIFPVPGTVYHGGRMGDLQAGVAWAVFSDKKDDTKPTWVVGLDMTFPTAERYDPAQGRDVANPQDWLSPYDVAAKRAPIGHKAWAFDLYTALSKRMGAIDPYFKAHVTAMRKSASTYSNCEHAADVQEAANGSNTQTAQMAAWADANCKAQGDSAGAQLPFVTGIVFGTEIVPYEDKVENQKVTLDLRLLADYTSSARWYNELTDATGKLLWTDPYVTVGALVGLDLRFSDVVSLRGDARLETETSHFITGEKPGGAIPTLAAYAATPAQYAALNPNYDARYDAPGSRFRATEVGVFTVDVAFQLRF